MMLTSNNFLSVRRELFLYLLHHEVFEVGVDLECYEHRQHVRKQ